MPQPRFRARRQPVERGKVVEPSVGDEHQPQLRRRCGQEAADAEIEEKFDALAAPVLPAEMRQRVKGTVWQLEALGSIGGLMALLKAG